MMLDEEFWKTSFDFTMMFLETGINKVASGTVHRYWLAASCNKSRFRNVRRHYAKLALYSRPSKTAKKLLFVGGSSPDRRPAGT